MLMICGVFMDIFEKMIKEAKRANAQDDLPDDIFADINRIYQNRDDYLSRENLIEDLIECLEDYEPFADVGCGNESFSTADVKRAVLKILS